MKNCTRLDIVSTSTISVEQKLRELSKKSPTKKVVHSSEGRTLANKLGSNWKAVGSAAEISSVVNGVTGTVKVKRDEKTKHYSFSIRFDMKELTTKRTVNTDTIKQEISNGLLALVKSSADLGNKLGD
jgi:hypothetical protein